MTNPVIDCLMNHRSIRQFTPQPIDEDTLTVLLNAGIRAASAANLQHYSLIVVDDDAKKKALTRFEVPVVIVAVVDQYRFKRWLDLNDAPFYNNQFANVLLSLWDAHIALHNIVVAAEGLGLGTVYIGAASALDLQQILGTPEYVFPAGMVCIGHPAESPDLRPRLPLEAVVHRNGYHIPTDDEVRTFHREKDAAWDQLPDDERQTWEARGIHNVAQMQTLGHYTEDFIRNRSRAVLENLRKAGFKLDDAP